MSDLNSFYALLDELARRTGGHRTLSSCHGKQVWPGRGVYFFFEQGEDRADGSPRVVRVGTHALTDRSRSTLWGRLSQHRGNVAGRLPGGGSHRGSIFRLHVGMSLLGRDGDADGVLANWGAGGSASRLVRDREHPLERRVSAYIGGMPFLWLAVDDAPGPTSDRGLIEVGAISLLSRRASPTADAASPTWLGGFSDRPSVTESGLWNVNHVDAASRPRLLERMDYWVRRM